MCFIDETITKNICEIKSKRVKTYLKLMLDESKG